MKDGDTLPKDSASLECGLRLLSAQEVPLGLALSLWLQEAWGYPQVRHERGSPGTSFLFQVRTLFVSGLPLDIKPRELYLLFRPFKVSNWGGKEGLKAWGWQHGAGLCPSLMAPSHLLGSGNPLKSKSVCLFSYYYLIVEISTKHPF